MSPDTWREFFELMTDVIELPGTAREKGFLVMEQAALLGFENVLEEFVQEVRDADEDFNT